MYVDAKSYTLSTISCENVVNDQFTRKKRNKSKLAANLDRFSAFEQNHRLCFRPFMLVQFSMTDCVSAQSKLFYIKMMKSNYD